MRIRLLSSIFAALLLSANALFADQKPAVKEGWVEVHSTHFSVITDAGEKKGREITLRLEQMRSVFGDLLMRDKIRIPVPLQVLALKSAQDYQRVAPMPNSVPITAPGFFLPGEDQNFIVLNTTAEEPWRAIEHPFAHMLLNGNYPPAQSWFDEGFAEYFASLRPDNKTMEIGGDPEPSSRHPEDIQGNIIQTRNPPKSLSELLAGPLWLKMSELLTMRLPSPEGTHRTLFYAQSWMVMHYLLSKKMLGQTGKYFDLIQNQNVPVDQALQQAFGMNSDQFEKAVKEYFQTLTPLLTAQQDPGLPDSRKNGSQTGQFPAPVGPDEVAVVVRKFTDDDGHAVMADVMARQPQHREQGIKELQVLAQEPADNEIAHRALAYAYIQKKDFKQAADELSEAADANPKDMWVRYYNAALRFRMAQATGEGMQGGLANVQQGLKEVLDWYPDFGEAHHMLGLAELQGGGINAALDSMRVAIQLSPRNQWYVMNLADVYLAAKKWDNGQAILERLKVSENNQIASTAKRKLEDLPFLRKYGVLPENAPDAQKERTVTAGAKDEKHAKDEPDGEGSDTADAEPKLKERAPDRRSVQNAKGKIVSVDCSHAPRLVVTFSAAGRVLKLYTDDIKSVALIGTEVFSCDWRNQAAAINYKLRSKAEGDLVSVEVE